MGFIQIKTDKKIGEAIVKTIAFFDLFDYPLTDFELWQYSSINCDIVDIKNILESNILINIVEEKNGFYFIKGRSKIVEARMKRYNYTDQKFKRAILMARIFKIIPWIKMIAVSNIMGGDNLKDESDIDLFIISENKRIWLTRFFCAGFTKLLGLRPKEGEGKDKICLNFYISERAMDLRGLMLDSNKDTRDSGFLRRSGYGGRVGYRVSNFIDIYFMYWLAGLVPIYDTNGTYKKFIRANDWIKRYLPNWQLASINKRRNAGKSFPDIYHDMVDLLIGGLEQNVKKWQLKKMPENLRKIMNKDTRVVINDQVLKLHVKDRREVYQTSYNKKLRELLIT